MKELNKLLCLIALVHIAAMVGVYVWWEPIWLFISLAGIVLFFHCGHDLYHHRYLSHRAFSIARGWQYLFSLCGIFVLFGTPISIAAVHVRHHRFADTNKDPHPAHRKLAAWFWLYPEMRQAHDTATVRRLMRDPWLRFLTKNYFKVYLLGVSAAALTDPRIMVYGFCIPVVYAFFCNSVINVACHTWGSKPFDTLDNSRNNHWANALLMLSGVALHNNHHAHPSRASMSNRWYEVDLVAALIWIIRNDFPTKAQDRVR